MLMLAWKLGPALTCGNTIILNLLCTISVEFPYVNDGLEVRSSPYLW